MAEGGLDMPAPILATAYQSLSRGLEAFEGCRWACLPTVSRQSPRNRLAMDACPLPLREVYGLKGMAGLQALPAEEAQSCSPWAALFCVCAGTCVRHAPPSS